MTKKFLYFQPEYVREFVCDGTKCSHNCCERRWTIDIDAETYRQYTQIRPTSKAREILDCFTYNSDAGKYFLKDRPCPFLTEKKLCRLQLEYGENFLSQTCTSYPRQTLDFEKFFERSLSLTCPLAAEMILFNEEPMKFELVNVSEQEHLRGGKIIVAKVHAGKNFHEQMLNLQVAMISILQERTLTIDQRLIVLGFFLDRFDEIVSEKIFNADALTNLIEAYESKKFLSEQVPRMLAAVTFDARKFVIMVLTLLEKIYGGTSLGIVNLIAETLKIFPDANGKVSVAEIAANYERLSVARKNFLARRSTFLENYLVNELFLNCVPWQFKESVARNFGVFVAEYKIFELLLFAAAQKNFDGKDDLLQLVDWFTNQTNHGADVNQKILEQLGNADDIFSLMETFLQP